MNRLLRGFLFVYLSIFLTSCLGVAQTAYQAAGLYNSARGATNAYYANEMMKSFKDAEPLFVEYDSVAVETMIAPRDEAKSTQVVNAFKDNFKYIVTLNIKEMDSGKSVCTNRSCNGKTIVIQFKERGYDENMAQKFLIGEKVRGVLYYVDKQTGNVIRAESLEAAENYEKLLTMAHISIASKLVKSIPDTKKAQKAAQKVTELDPIKPEYKKLFQES